MRDWMEEVLIVVGYSTRTRLAIVLGVVFFVGFMLAGQVFVDRIELHGLPAPLTDVVKDRLLHRYDRAAWIAPGSFLLLAVRAYRKDRRKLLGL